MKSVSIFFQTLETIARRRLAESLYHVFVLSELDNHIKNIPAHESNRTCTVKAEIIRRFGRQLGR